MSAFGTSVDLTSLPSGFTVLSGADPQNLGTLPSGGADTATWSVRWNCTPGQTAVIHYNVRTTSYGETITESKGKTVLCENIFL